MTEDQKKLVEDNMKLAYHYVHKYGFSFGLDFDDAVQIASLGLCYAAMKFDPSRKISFSTYAYTCMTNQFLQLNRKKNAKCRNFEEVSIDSELLSESGEVIGNLADTIPSNIDIELETVSKDKIKYTLDHMKGVNKKIIEYIIQNPGVKQTDVKTQLNVSQPTVSKAIKQFKQIYYSD